MQRVLVDDEHPVRRFEDEVRVVDLDRGAGDGRRVGSGGGETASAARVASAAIPGRRASANAASVASPGVSASTPATDVAGFARNGSGGLRRDSGGAGGHGPPSGRLRGNSHGAIVRSARSCTRRREQPRLRSGSCLLSPVSCLRPAVLPGGTVSRGTRFSVSSRRLHRRCGPASRPASSPGTAPRPSSGGRSRPPCPAGA